MPDSIVMVQAFKELRYGVVVHMRENSVKYGHNFNQPLYTERPRATLGETLRSESYPERPLFYRRAPHR